MTRLARASPSVRAAQGLFSLNSELGRFRALLPLILIITATGIGGCGAPSPTVEPMVLPTAALPAEPTVVVDEPSVEIAYVGNTGFLITCGEDVILVDALFNESGQVVIPSEIVAQLASASPPFDGVDLILVTHAHPDHFDAGMIRSHLRSNPETLLVSTQEVQRQVLPAGASGLEAIEGRVLAVHPAMGQPEPMSVGTIRLEVVALPHGPDATENLGFIITVGGRTLFHTGDVWVDERSLDAFLSNGVPQKAIDVAFVACYFLMDEALYPVVREGIRAEYVVPMHFPGGFGETETIEAIQQEFPNAVFFQQELDSWSLP